jgi:hypothetical protein
MTPQQNIDLIRTLLNDLESQITAVQPRLKSVLNALRKHKDGLRIEQLRSEVEGDPSKTLKALMDAGKVKKKGERRSTTYTAV